MPYQLLLADYAHAGIITEQSRPDAGPEGLARTVDEVFNQYGREGRRNELIDLGEWYSLFHGNTPDVSGVATSSLRIFNTMVSYGSPPMHVGSYRDRQSSSRGLGREQQHQDCSGGRLLWRFGMYRVMNAMKTMPRVPATTR